MAIKGKRLLVFSCHAADYVWRSGGTIAKYVKEGATVKVVVLSLGIRGESGHLWKIEGQTTENVAKIRIQETLAAAKCLGVEDIELWGLQDYPLEITKEVADKLLLTIRTFRPDIILTHDKYDVLNPDHNALNLAVHAAAIQSNSAGVLIEGTKVTKQMRLFGFEPHQTELSGFKPGIFIDITDVYDKKDAAMHCFNAQQHLIEIYQQRAILRGNHARRLSGNNSYKYAECFAPFFPPVCEELI